MAPVPSTAIFALQKCTGKWMPALPSNLSELQNGTANWFNAPHMDQCTYDDWGTGVRLRTQELRWEESGCLWLIVRSWLAEAGSAPWHMERNAFMCCKGVTIYQRLRWGFSVHVLLKNNVLIINTVCKGCINEVNIFWKRESRVCNKLSVTSLDRITSFKCLQGFSGHQLHDQYVFPLSDFYTQQSCVLQQVWCLHSDRRLMWAEELIIPLSRSSTQHQLTPAAWTHLFPFTTDWILLHLPETR